jgi:hypothetical protein
MRAVAGAVEIKSPVDHAEEGEGGISLTVKLRPQQEIPVQAEVERGTPESSN